MKHKLFFAICAIALCACNHPVTNPETPEDSITPPATANALYVKGFRINALYSPLKNMYYRIELSGQSLMGNNIQFAHTDFSAFKLNNDNVPYVILLSPLVKIGDMPNPLDWYSTFQLTAYAAANISANGAPCLDVTIPASELPNKTEYTAVSSTNGTSVTILFEYK